MKLLCLVTATCLVAYSPLLAKQRDWKIGTLVETAHAQGPAMGGPHIGLGSDAKTARDALRTAENRTTVWQGFSIQGDGYRFLVMCPVRRNHTPNVTVNGPVKFTMEKGKFYLLDDDAKEWEMTVLEKALVPVPPPVPPNKEQ